MSPRVTRGSVVAVLAVLLAGTATEARADWILTPFLGGTFASETIIPDLEQGEGTKKLVVGASAGWLGDGVLGVELDFAYIPRFFESDSTAGLVSGSNVVTMSGDLLVTLPVSVTQESLRPYLAVGGGWVHAAIEESLGFFPELFGRARNSFGMNIGGGAIGFLTPRTGLRFDIRHVRSLERDTNPFSGDRGSLVSFWRATVGMVVRP